MNDNNFEPGPLAEVHCRTDGARATLVFVRHLHHAPPKVWAALTDPAQLRQWAPFVADRNLDHVGDATLTMTDSDHGAELATSVRVCQPPTLLEYTWGDGILRWELEATADGTRLTLHHTVEDRSWVPKVAAGWHLCLLVAERLLDGHPIAPIVGEKARDFGWESLNEAYAESLGIENTGWPDMSGGEARP